MIGNENEGTTHASSSMSSNTMASKTNLFFPTFAEFSLFTRPVLVDDDAAIFADADPIATPSGRIDGTEGKIAALVQVGAAG